MPVTASLSGIDVADFSPSSALHWRLLRRVSGYRRRLERHEAILARLRAEAATKLHLGCGNKLLAGYVNVDAFSPRADLKADICTLDPFADGAADLIESHHVLEHLSFAQASAALSVWKRKLRTGGHVILSVPDMDACCRMWLQTPDERRFEDGAISRMIFGSQEHEGMFHKSGYTAQSLTRQLTAAGLKVRQVALGYPYRPTPSFLILAQREA